MVGCLETPTYHATNQPVLPITSGGCGLSKYHSGQCLAIFEADHSPSPLLKIAATFFDRTSRAAVSASTRSLRSSSRSSSLIRFLSCRVACGLARASSGSVRAIAFTLEERGRAMRPDILGVDLRFFGGSANCAWDTEYLGVATQGRTCAG